MARIRTIKPEFFLDTELAELSRDARFLFIGLWTLADREGRLEDNHKRIKAQLFPWDDINIEILLKSMAPKFIMRYESNRHHYIQIINFCKHQRPNIKEAPSQIPPPKQSKHEKESAKHGNFHASTLDKGKGMERGKGGVEGKAVLPTAAADCTTATLSFPPSFEQIQTYCTELRSTVNPRAIFDFYQANGWMIGKNVMKDWKAAVRMWELRDSSKSNKSGVEYR